MRVTLLKTVLQLGPLLVGIGALVPVGTSTLAPAGTTALGPAGPATHAEDAGQQVEIAPRDVSFPTADGGVTHAHVYGDGARAIVLAHGGRFTKESWSEQAPVLAADGFRVVAIDFRGRGDSHGGPGWEERHDAYHLDVLAAVSWLHETGADGVSVVGGSFGGWAAALAAIAAEPGAIERLVLLAAPGIDAPERLPGRKLFITARDDTDGSGRRRLVDIRDQYQRAPQPKELVILDGDAHAQFLFETEQAGPLLDEIRRFLAAP